jgi:hypothetical protein
MLMAKTFGCKVRLVRIKGFERSSHPMVEPKLVDTKPVQKEERSLEKA